MKTSAIKEKGTQGVSIFSVAEFKNLALALEPDIFIEKIEQIVRKNDFNEIETLELILNHPKSNEIGLMLSDDKVLIYIFKKILLKKYQKFYKTITSTSFASMEQVKNLHQTLSGKLIVVN